MADGMSLGLIGGTGLTELDESIESISIETPYGHPSADIRIIRTEPVRLLFLPGMAALTVIPRIVLITAPTCGP